LKICNKFVYLVAVYMDRKGRLRRRSNERKPQCLTVLETYKVDTFLGQIPTFLLATPSETSLSLDLGSGSTLRVEISANQKAIATCQQSMKKQYIAVNSEKAKLNHLL
jgi:hypothetical protein